MKRHNLVIWVVLIVGAVLFVASLVMAYVATSHYREQVLRTGAVDIIDAGQPRYLAEPIAVPAAAIRSARG